MRGGENINKKRIGEISSPILHFSNITNEEKADLKKSGSQASSLLECQWDYRYNRDRSFKQ